MRTSSAPGVLICLLVSMTLTQNAYSASSRSDIGPVARAMERAADTCEFALDTFSRVNVFAGVSQGVFWGIEYLEAINAFYHIRAKQPDRPSFRDFYNARVLSAERDQRGGRSDSELGRRENLVRAEIPESFDVFATSDHGAVLYGQGLRLARFYRGGNVVILRDDLVVGIARFRGHRLRHVRWSTREEISQHSGCIGRPRT